MYTAQRCGHLGSGMEGSVELKNRESGYVLNVQVQCLIDIGGEGVSGTNRLLKKAFLFLPTKPISELFTGEGRGRIAFALGEGAIWVLRVWQW